MTTSCIKSINIYSIFLPNYLEMLLVLLIYFSMEYRVGSPYEPHAKQHPSPNMCKYITSKCEW